VVEEQAGKLQAQVELEQLSEVELPSLLVVAFALLVEGQP